MTVKFDLNQPFRPSDFAKIVGITSGAVTNAVKRGQVTHDGTLGCALHSYIGRLRDQAAGRYSHTQDGEAMDLTQERAKLARSQYEGQEIKNAIARKEWAPIGILADVLGKASSSVVDRLDQLESEFRKSSPDLPDSAKNVVLQRIADARNAWIKGTVCDMQALVEEMERDHEDEGGDKDQS